LNKFIKFYQVRERKMVGKKIIFNYRYGIDI